MAQFRKIWQSPQRSPDFARFGRIWKDLEGFGARFARILWDLAVLGRIWDDFAGFGRIWWDLGQL